MEYTISENYSLPSKGLIYTKPVESHVELRSMTTREEMKRQSSTTTPYKMLSDIIEACMIEKPAIKVYDMCLQDFEYLLHKLRVVSYGPNYKVTAGCPHCGKTFEATINLDELEVKEYDEKVANDMLTFTLPISNKVITLNYKTPRMLDTITLARKEFEKKNPNVDFDPSIMLELRYLIASVDGNVLNYAELDSFIQKLSVRDMKFIQDKSVQFEKSFGIDYTLMLTCDKCGGDVLSFFRIGPEFFRPSNY